MTMPDDVQLVAQLFVGDDPMKYAICTTLTKSRDRAIRRIRNYGDGHYNTHKAKAAFTGQVELVLALVQAWAKERYGGTLPEDTLKKLPEALINLARE